MNRLSLIILILAFAIAPALGQKYKKKQIVKDLNTIEGFENAFIGFVLYDPEKDKVIAAQNADKHMTPASVTKLFTADAALVYLPETLSAAEYTINGDSLIFWSTGYPLTLHQDHRDSTLIEFLSQSDKQIYYWPRPSEDERFAPGWGWDDYSGYYGAEKSLFPIYGNSVQFIIDNDNQTFDHNPKHQGIKVSVDTATSERARVSRDEFWNEFSIQFGEEGIDTLVRPFRYSDQLFTELLEEETGQSIELLKDYTKSETFQELKGAQRDTLLKWMLHPSDNLFAEQFLQMISGTQSDTLGVKKAIDLSTSVSALVSGLDGPPQNRPVLDHNLAWRDGSGLTRYNMFKPNEILKLLKNLNLDLAKNILPQGQTSGTIKDWYSPAIYAKTGTLSNNHSLAGYIETEKGKTLIFVLMANHYTASTTKIRENFGLILEKIRKGY